jgi:Sporulation and spore germination
MIPRYQRVLFWILIGGIALMAAFLLHGCQQAHKRLTAFSDATPIAAPTTASTEDVTLYLASDTDGSITATSSQVALPKDAGIRARILLDHLIAQYALPTSAHPLQPGPAVDDVFLLNNQAIINLRSSFTDNHPSGVLVEDLTIKSIIGTLHAALPQITEIRFLVDGEPHDTLAGHADLQRTYPATDTTTKPTSPSEEATQQ